MIHIAAQGITNVVFRASMRRIMLLQAESKNQHVLLDADHCSLRPKSTWREVFSEKLRKTMKTEVLPAGESEERSRISNPSCR